MKLMTNTFALTAIFALGLLASAPSAIAKPLDVDCDLLEATTDAVNDFLDEEGIQFSNVGDLFSSAIQDEAVFDQLSALVLLFSGGEIDFESPREAIATYGKCGLIPQLIDNIRD
jgi:hypothetical protein